jgi:hypothetical protein
MVDQREDIVVVTLKPAVIHKRAGEPGVDAGELQITIEFAEAECTDAA